MTINIDRRKKEFIVDTRSPVTKISLDEEVKKRPENFIDNKKYLDVNKNEVNVAKTKYGRSTEWKNQKLFEHAHYRTRRHKAFTRYVLATRS